MSNFLKKFGPTLLAIGSTLLTAFTPQIQGEIAKHPTVVTVIASVITIVSHLLPSPVAGK